MHMHVHVVFESSGLILHIFFTPIWRLNMYVQNAKFETLFQFCFTVDVVNRYHTFWHNTSSTWFSSSIFFILLPHSFIRSFKKYFIPSTPRMTVSHCRAEGISFLLSAIWNTYLHLSPLLWVGWWLYCEIVSVCLKHTAFFKLVMLPSLHRELSYLYIPVTMVISCSWNL